MKIKGEDLFLKQNHMYYANKMNYKKLNQSNIIIIYNKEKMLLLQKLLIKKYNRNKKKYKIRNKT